ncbi:hypothetical protein ABZ557_18995 [Streptomyces sp. NPDC019645]|uniref:hypothetical protein n=1 Tax=Streptomyces sp. NPDC019645 TaxID=3154786 RepID=UPI00340F4E4D
MDELHSVRELRAHIPSPDAARLASGRQRLLDEIARPRRPGRGWSLAAVAAATAVIAVAVLATLLPGNPPPAPAAPPRGDQWVHHTVRTDGWSCGYDGTPDGYYMEGLGWELDNRAFNRTLPPCSPEPRHLETDEHWMRYDGSQATRDGNRVLENVLPYLPDSLTPQKSDALMAELPEDDPEGVLRLIRRQSIPTRLVSANRKTQSQRDYDEIVEVLAGAPAATTDQRRILYRVITGLDGATRPVTTTDGIGRKVVAIGVEGNQRDYPGQRNTYQVLLDPRTYVYRGARVVAGLGYYVNGKASGGPFVAKGTVIATVTRERTEIVDDRPSDFVVERAFPRGAGVG